MVNQRYDGDAGGVIRARGARWGSGLGLAVIGLILMPTVAFACGCGIEGQRAARTRDPARAVIFVGHALEVDERPDSRTKVVVKFLVMSSWRGIEADTLTLRVNEDAGCVGYAEGARYLVHADLAPEGTRGPRHISGPCDERMPIDWERVRDSIAALGPPRWTAPPFGHRAIDRHSVPLGAPLQSEADSGDVGFRPPNDPAIARIEIGDFRGTGGPDLRSMRVKPGLYQLRVVWADGTTNETYLSMRCHPNLRVGCHSFVSWPQLR